MGTNHKQENRAFAPAKHFRPTRRKAFLRTRRRVVGLGAVGGLGLIGLGTIGVVPALVSAWQNQRAADALEVVAVQKLMQANRTRDLDDKGYKFFNFIDSIGNPDGLMTITNQKDRICVSWKNYQEAYSSLKMPENRQAMAEKALLRGSVVTP